MSDIDVLLKKIFWKKFLENRGARGTYGRYFTLD